MGRQTEYVSQKTWVEFIKTRDKKLRDYIVFQNMQLVISTARRVRNCHMSAEDKIQVGIVGLIQAIDNYDPERETKFSTYATSIIRGKILNSNRDEWFLIKVPRKLIDLNKLVVKTIQELSVNLLRKPTITEISKKLDLSEKKVEEALDISNAHKIRSFDGDILKNYSDFIGELDEELEEIVSCEYDDLIKVLRSLDEKKQDIIRLRFCKEMTQREIGEIFHVSQMTINKLIRASLSEIKSKLIKMNSELSTTTPKN